jgi:hypothetical protein
VTAGWAVSSEIEIRAPRGAVYDALVDVPGYPELWRGMTRARTLVEEGDVAIVEIAAGDLQGGQAVFEVLHCPPDSMRFTQVRTRGGRGLSGRCDLSEDEEEGVTVASVEVHPQRWLVSPGTRRRLRQVIEEGLVALQARVEGVTAPAPSRRKILELVFSPGGLELRLEDAVYTLTRKEER